MTTSYSGRTFTDPPSFVSSLRAIFSTLSMIPNWRTEKTIINSKNFRYTQQVSEGGQVKRSSEKEQWEMSMEHSDEEDGG